MRLTTFQVRTLCDSAQKNFGQDTHVWLFGSRVDDEARGGDIDLYIEAQISDASELMNATLQFLRDLHRQLGEQKIDVVLRRAGSPVDLPIYRIAKQTGVFLQ